MIRVLENQEKKLYYATSSDWECVVLAKDAIEAAGESLEEAFDTFGDNLNLSSCINIINCSELHEKHMIEPEQVEFDIFYVPSVLADIGKHKLSKQLDEIIQNIEKKA
ncbi:MAG TPA: hypothetical protein EYG21_08710 [Nitrospinaceae bacterium]|jgi:hypothetical protein|nr:hypothetical protein [Nitrospinaceae bacterium]